MWYLKNIGEVYVYHELDGSYCFEYCNEYIDEEGNKAFVPDSMHDKFIEIIGAEEN